ncbi:hypothetical protein COT93_00055 [Candidatus Falkowbacteria bacterium CG10_big_fil_rev_8_21_14_0_10_37_18]|uniref:HAD family hydrolase n=1 Tax=Candidatus Falkowbacteria bacterium CG10_big_fil_rev_8_21_14_0_10_37_18 TaxID=1974562 RepID=A0A2H0V9X2_9BACT|nr:MAG: hypothetical protein AUJ26_00495 [Candidatus Falkowbacteria bacterium CG1_02_37_21]PIR95884.1 MAG: hypothetical protein COT93_00055 [Candidatus Falkowbacteria bacterium CG10_big_fil_rev_8_21_14_0_10_37_18]
MTTQKTSFVKHFSFDFDGTTINTTIAGFNKVNTVLKLIGLSPVSHDYLRPLWGEKFDVLANIVCRYVGGTAEHVQAFLETEKEIPFTCEINEEFFLTLDELRRRDCLVSLLTSRDIDSLLKLSKNLGFDLDVFNYIQTPEDTKYHKPDGRVFEPLFEWAATKNCQPENTIYFGDTVKYDLAATLNSKPPIKFVGVVSGVNTAPEFYLNGVKDIVYSIDDLPEYLRSISNE